MSRRGGPRIHRSGPLPGPQRPEQRQTWIQRNWRAFVQPVETAIVFGLFIGALTSGDEVIAYLLVFFGAVIGALAILAAENISKFRKIIWLIVLLVISIGVSAFIHWRHDQIRLSENKKVISISYDRIDNPNDNPIVVEGKPASINYFYSNHGTLDASKATSHGELIFLRQDYEIDRSILSAYQKEFEEKYLRYRIRDGSTLFPGKPHFGTAETRRILSYDDISDLKNNRAQLLLLVGVGWTDAKGDPNYLFQCLWATHLPEDGNPINASWHGCN